MENVNEWHDGTCPHCGSRWNWHSTKPAYECEVAGRAVGVTL